MQYQDFVEQDRVIDEIANYYDHPPAAYVHSFGCQQNVNDGEKIKGVLLQAGYNLTDQVQQADLVVFNTCAVREHAQQRVYGNIGALKALKNTNPKMLIAIGGCMVQQKEVVDKLKQSFPYVDVVFGVNAIEKLPSLLAQRIRVKRRVLMEPVERYDIVENLPIHRDSNFKAWLPIMYGCDNFCSYCIVPFVRGRERSRKPEDILTEFRSLVQSGYKEITLLGQNVNSYGKGLERKMDFADLLALLAEQEGDFRIRFMTSHPKDASRKLIDTIASHEKICKNLHLPVQSGSDRILVQMNRKYDTAQYLGLIDYARKTIPQMTFSSDIIVGFPGETEEDFEQTVALVRRVRYVQLFTFIFSKRSGTRAALMKDDTPYKVKAERINRLIKIQDEIAREEAASLADSCCKVLVESAARSEGQLAGRLDNNLVVEFCGDPSLIGSFATVRIAGSKGIYLSGELCGESGLA